MMATPPSPTATAPAVRPPGATTGARAPPVARRAFAAVLTLVAVYAALDVVAQMLPPHYSAITQPESDLAVGPYGGIMTLNFVVRGALSLLFLWAFGRTVASAGGSWRQYRGGTISLAVWAVGAFVLAAFPTDVPSTPISGHGAVHLVAAIVAFLGGAIGVYWLSRGFAQTPILRPVQGWATALGVLSLVLVVLELTGGLFVPRISDRIGGLLERIFLASVLLWIALVALYLLRASGAFEDSSAADRTSRA